MAMEAHQTVSATELQIHIAGGTARDEERLRGRFGDGSDWRDLPGDALRRAGLSPALVARLVQLADGRELERELSRCQKEGVRLVSWRAENYPSALRTLHRPPVLLTVRGRWPAPDPALAVVGARAATPSGRTAARRLAGAAAAAGIGVVSGLARGIDRYALESALDEGGHVVAVLGNGMHIAHPRENRALQDRIARQGTLVSEFPLDQRPTRWTFPKRNRIIAALSRATLVVEAGRRSGALITADHALELGRDVFAVPGAIDSPQSEGSNRLLRDGAAPVIDEGCLLELLGAESLRDDDGRDLPTDPVLATLARGTFTGDDLAEATGLTIAAVRSRLMALELEGRVAGLPGDRWCARGGP
jgi:DNA processing protein